MAIRTMTATTMSKKATAVRMRQQKAMVIRMTTAMTMAKQGDGN
jgi:hypothetical protein